MQENNNPFVFEISLSILDHLGRNLYRNFVTILGEAISNSWDADASNVWIYVDGDNFVIKDDGIGMDFGDFQGKFLRVGYSKRKNDNTLSAKGRPLQIAYYHSSSLNSLLSKTFPENHQNPSQYRHP